MGTHPIFESDFDCLTDIFKMPYYAFSSRLPTLEQDEFNDRISHASRRLSALRESGLDLSEFATLVDQSTLPTNHSVQISSFLGATKVLRDTFEEYASQVGDRTMMTRAKFIEFCIDVNRRIRIPPMFYEDMFRRFADKDNNDLLDFQEFVTLLLDQNLNYLLNISL